VGLAAPNSWALSGRRDLLPKMLLASNCFLLRASRTSRIRLSTGDRRRQRQSPAFPSLRPGAEGVPEAAPVPAAFPGLKLRRPGPLLQNQILTPPTRSAVLPTSCRDTRKKREAPFFTAKKPTPEEKTRDAEQQLAGGDAACYGWAPCLSPGAHCQGAGAPPKELVWSSKCRSLTK